MKKITLCLALLSALVSADVALACSCAPQPPPQEAMRHSAAVFTGTVLEITDSGTNPGSTRQVRIRVERVWKGAKCGEVTITTGLGDADCGYNFQPGQGYLIYAFKQKGQLGTNICTRTRPAAEAGEDLTALGEPSQTCP